MGLAQVFTVTQPLGGVSAIALSSVSLYFANVGTYPLDIQIREVANGMPTYNLVKNSRVTVRSTDKYANGASVLKTSADGSVPSVIEFLKPVQLNSLSKYSLMILPAANDPAYILWAATANGVDQTTKAPVQFNGAVGPLISWDPGADRTVEGNKALKFSMNKAFANTAKYYDDNFNFNEEHVIVNGFTAPFVIGEPCYMTQDNFNLVLLNLFTPLTTGTFINGETFIQNLGGGNNPVTGKVYYSNSSVLFLTDVVGTISNTKIITGGESGANAWITYVNTSIICSSSSNTITLPFTGNGSSNLFYTNQSIHLTSSDLKISQPFIVTSVKDSTHIQVSWNPVFNDTQCSAGWLRGDRLALKMNYQGYDAIKQNNFAAIFNNSTANTQINQNFHFSNSLGQHIIGQSSRARCMSYGTIDLEYHNVIPQFHFDQAEENRHVLYWGAYQSYSDFTSQYPAVWRYIVNT